MANDYTHVLKTFCVSETVAHLWLFVAPCLNVITYLLTYYVFLRVIVIIINVIIIAMLMVLLCKS